MISVLELLSQGSSRPPVQGHLEPEDQLKLKRQERKFRPQLEGQRAIFSNKPREWFKPSAEMLDVRKDIEQARLRVARAYNRLTITGNGVPNFRSLEKFRELVRKATLLENKYKDLEVVTRKARQAKREAEVRNISEHKERAAVQPLTVSLRNISDSVEKAKDNLAEGVINLDEFRDFMKVLATDSLKASADALSAL